MMLGKWLILGWLFLPSAAWADRKELVIVENGQPRATVVIAANADEKVKLAAQELQATIEKMSGAKLPLATDEQNPPKPLILVGQSRLTDSLKLAIPSGVTGARREEGFLIVCKRDRLILAGNNDGPYHGTEYAVYEFLNRLGVRWFMPGEFGEIVPKRTTVAFPEIELTEKPDFIQRNWWLHAKPELADLERKWKLHNKMNPDTMFTIPGDSSVRNVVGDQATFKEHPEYFGLNQDGTRNPFMPNLTHPKAVEIAAQAVKDYFRKNPTVTSYGFAPDDGYPRDYDPETLKQNQGFVEIYGRPGVPSEASISEEWMNFVNNVTREVRKEFPEAYIATNGYANRDIPPLGIKLDDHLVIMFAAIWSCTIHGYDDDHCWHKVRQGQMLKRWCELCPNVWIYGYNYQMLVSALTPLPEGHKLRRDFPLMKKWGVIGFLDETRNIWAECGIASRYLRARLEWNANADVDAILNDFYEQWYGPSAGPMRAFYGALEEAIERTPMHGHEDRILPEVYTPELMVALAKQLTEAEKLARTETAGLRVRVDRLIYEHLKRYVAMSASEWAADFADAARQAQGMLDLRKELHQVNPFFVWPDEDGYHTGIWYWGVTARRNYYQNLADRTSGKTGDMVAVLSDRAMFRTDPHEAGVFERWYASDLHEDGWKTLQVTRPFYRQGYQDKQGHPYIGFLWYRFKVDVPALGKDRKVMLYTPTVETEAWGWVNGEYVGHQPYQEAYIRPLQMEFDVTQAIHPGKTNQITIRVNTSLMEAQASAGLFSRVFLYSPKPVSP